MGAMFLVEGTVFAGRWQGEIFVKRQKKPPEVTKILQPDAFQPLAGPD
jgi:hypothetical protein